MDFGSEESRAGYGKSKEYDYERNGESEELQLQTPAGPERVVRCAKQPGALSLDLEKNDNHQEYGDQYLDYVENRHV